MVYSLDLLLFANVSNLGTEFRQLQIISICLLFDLPFEFIENGSQRMAESR